MKKYNSLPFILLGIFTFFTISCQRDLDVPPVLTYEGEATHTIAQLLAMRTTASFDTLPENMVIKGVVVSSDKEGNCYKFLAIQDGTAGIQIQINNSILYQKYPLGQTVYVKCKELVLSEYRGLLQLNWLHEGASVRLPSTKEADVIFRDSVPKTQPKPAIIKKGDDIAPVLYNQLVKLENCYFESPGVTYHDASSGYSATSRYVYLNDENRTRITVRTSSYATFASSLTPSGNGDLVGILTVYAGYTSTEQQLILRSLDDVQNFAEPITEHTIVTTDMSVNPLENGWTQENITGSQRWEYRNNNELRFTGDGSANDSWLVSPAYSELNGYKSIKLLLNHRVPNNNGNPNTMKIYYTTVSQSGNFNASDWTELQTTATQYPSSGGEISFELPDQATGNPNFRIALRYNDNRPSVWIVSGVSFKGVSKQ